MSTLEDFENAPVGATANGGKWVKIRPTNNTLREWIEVDKFKMISALDSLSNEKLAATGFTLDPAPAPAPTNSREALDLAWNLAHDVREGQVIPKDTRYLGRYSEPLQEFTATDDIEIVSWLVGSVRSHEPLPDPEPGWVNAPAVMAECKCSPGEQTVYVCYSEIAWTCTDCDNSINPEDMKNVTPLYPEEDNGGMYITGPGTIQIKDRNGQTVWEI